MAATTTITATDGTCTSTQQQLEKVNTELSTAQHMIATLQQQLKNGAVAGGAAAATASVTCPACDCGAAKAHNTGSTIDLASHERTWMICPGKTERHVSGKACVGDATDDARHVMSCHAML